MAAPVGEGAPAHFLAVTHGLRFGQHDVLSGYIAAVQFDELTRLAVVVVVHGAAAVVVEGVQFGRKLHGVADARQHY